MDQLAQGAEAFIGVFQEGADWFGGIVTGVLPLVIILLTAVNALIRLVGQDRINKVAEFAGRPGVQYTPVRYLVVPVLSVFFLTNPAAYTMGTFLPEKNKPAFYDSAVSFVHPITGLFPHANAGELFVYIGIATGIETLGFGLGDLAIRYLLVGMVVIFIRGLVTQLIFDVMSKRRQSAEAPATAGGAA